MAIGSASKPQDAKTPPAYGGASILYPPSPRQRPQDESGLEDSEDELPGGTTLSEWLNRLQLNPAHPRFFGKSSGVRLLQSAIDLKSEYSGNDTPLEDQFEQISARRPEFWHIRPVS
jgi:hypothetical protein